MKRYTLADLSVGDSGHIYGFTTGAGEYRRKLMAMGLTSNTPFKVKRVAPLGDPVEITVRNYNLSLRREEAKAVLIKGESK